MMIIKMLRDHTFTYRDENDEHDEVRITFKKDLELECEEVKWRTTHGGICEWSLMFVFEKDFLNNDKVRIEYLTDEAEENMIANVDTYMSVSIEHEEVERKDFFKVIKSRDTLKLREDMKELDKEIEYWRRNNVSVMEMLINEAIKTYENEFELIYAQVKYDTDKDFGEFLKEVHRMILNDELSFFEVF